MIEVEEAKRLIEEQVQAISSVEIVDLASALDRVLAEAIIAPISLPSFHQSNVDGYAVKFAENSTKKWKVAGQIQAGENPKFTNFNTENSYRIFTGAKLPDDVDTVIMQEHIEREHDEICLKTENPLVKNQQVRKLGSQIKRGEIALEKGQQMNAAAVSFLSMLGINAIKVLKKPILSLIITGNEFQTQTGILEEGKVFEANSLSIKLALKKIGVEITNLVFVKDNKEALKTEFCKLLQTSDMILFSGGISVGDYDFVKEINDSSGTQTLFHKIAQKPGKPLFFGKNEEKYIFALPGNPASALTCIYEYVFLSLNLLEGKKDSKLEIKNAITLNAIPKKKGLAHFLKAKYENNFVTCLEGQESSTMKSFAESNCLIYLPSEKGDVSKNEEVEIHLLP